MKKFKVLWIVMVLCCFSLVACGEWLEEDYEEADYENYRYNDRDEDDSEQEYCFDDSYYYGYVDSGNDDYDAGYYEGYYNGYYGY